MRAMARPPHRRPTGGRSTRPARLDDTAIRGFRTQPGPRGAKSLMPLPIAVVEELRRIVGRESVIDSANGLRLLRRDASIAGASPDATVLPTPTHQAAGLR